MFPLTIMLYPGHVVATMVQMHDVFLLGVSNRQKISTKKLESSKNSLADADLFDLSEKNAICSQRRFLLLGV